MVDKVSSSHHNDKYSRENRAKLLRTTLRLNRPDCVRKFKIPIDSLQTWEEGRFGGLTRKGAQRLIEAYAQEGLILFHEHNENSVDTIISNDILAPHFQKGDLVAGIRFFIDDLHKAICTLCIVQTTDGEILTGYLESENTNHTYALFNCTGIKKKLIKDNLKLFSPAPVMWIRRNLSCFIKINSV